MLLGGALLTKHEMWRDEFQVWNLARASNSLSEMLANKRYEGHPDGWYLVVYPFAKTFRAPQAIQVLNFGIAIGYVSVFLLFAPFPWWQRVLFPFGYFALFEYGTIARMYGMGVLMVVLFLTLRRQGPKHLLGCVAAVAWLAETSVFGMILSVVLFGAYAIELALDHRASVESGWVRFKIGVGCSVWGLAAGLAVLRMVPPADNGYAQEWFFRWIPGRAVLALANVWKALVPIPPFRRTFWGYMGADNLITSARTQAVLGVVLLVLVVVVLFDRPFALATFLAGAVGCLGFAYAKDFGFPRHYGHLFVVLLAALWIAAEIDARCPEVGAQWRRTLRSGLTAGVLGCQLAAAIPAVVLEWRFPFSSAKEAAQVVTRVGGPSVRVVSDRDWSGVSIAGWLGRDVAFPRTGRSGSFVVWDAAWADANKENWDSVWSDINQRKIDGVVASGVRLHQDTHAPVFLVLDYPLDLGRYAGSVEKVAATAPAIVPDESYFVYAVVAR